MRYIFNKVPFCIRIVCLALYLMVVSALSLLPMEDLPKVPLFPGEDKLIHLTMYFGLTMVVLWTFHNRNIFNWNLYGFVILWGILMEIFQVQMQLGRSFAVLDIFSNISGAFLGVLMYKFLKNKYL